MPNAWIEHVKSYAAKNDVKYAQALKEAKATYVKPDKPSPPKNPKIKKESAARAPRKKKAPAPLPSVTDPDLDTPIDPM